MLTDAGTTAAADRPNLKSIEGVASALAAILILLAAALWNGFALLQYDTGGYIARWHEGTLEVTTARPPRSRTASIAA